MNTLKRFIALFRSDKTITGIQIVQPCICIPLVYLTLQKLSIFLARDDYIAIDGTLVRNTNIDPSKCKRITLSQDLDRFLHQVSDEYYKTITYLFVVFLLLFSFLWNFVKLLSDFMNRRKRKSLYDCAPLVHFLLSSELLTVWATLSYGALTFPVYGFNYGDCLSGGSTDQHLLFGDRYSAFIFLNVEACIAPLIVPLSVLLLLQMQKRQEEIMATHTYQIRQKNINPIHPLCMLMFQLMTAIIISSSMWVIISSENPGMIILLLLNTGFHLFQFIHMKQFIKLMHQRKLQKLPFRNEQILSPAQQRPSIQSHAFIHATKPKFSSLEINNQNMNSFSEACQLRKGQNFSAEK